MTNFATELILHWDSLIVQKHVIVEAILDGGAVAKASTIHPLHGFPQDVGTGVPVHLGIGEESYYCYFLLVSAGEGARTDKTASSIL